MCLCLFLLLTTNSSFNSLLGYISHSSVLSCRNLTSKAVIHLLYLLLYRECFTSTFYTEYRLDVSPCKCKGDIDFVMFQRKLCNNYVTHFI